MTVWPELMNQYQLNPKNHKKRKLEKEKGLPDRIIRVSELVVQRWKPYKSDNTEAWALYLLSLCARAKLFSEREQVKMKIMKYKK